MSNAYSASFRHHYNGDPLALWHAPLILNGQNFGKGDQLPFPGAGLLFMCVGCVFDSAFLTWITKHTGSVFPAAICHTIINTCMLLPTACLPDGEVLLKTHPFAVGMIALVFVPAPIGLFAFWALRNDSNPFTKTRTPAADPES